MTNSINNKLYGLDHLRALAIIFVFLYHYKLPFFGHPYWLKDVAKFGWTGVDLFFVLSGFLISSQLFAQIKEGNPISFKHFFLKRFFRIIPAYWVVLIIYFCFPFFHEREALAPLYKYVTFTQNFGLDIKNNGTFSHAWSLCVEEHFYLFLPIILICLSFTKFFNKSYWLLITLFLGGFVIRMFNWDNFYLPNIEKEHAWLYWYKNIYYPTYNRLDGLLVGVSIAGLYHFYPNLWRRLSKYGNLILIFSLVVLTGAYFLCYEEHSYGASIYGFPLVAIGYGLMVIGAISPTSFLYKWKSTIMTFIATLSFGIYLTHKGVIHLSQDFFLNYNIDVNSNLMLIISAISCLLAALILNFSIEKPFMKLRSKILANEKPNENQL